MFGTKEKSVKINIIKESFMEEAVFEQGLDDEQ